MVIFGEYLSLLLITGDDEAHCNTVIEFELKVKCTKNPKAPKDTTDPDELYLNSKGEK